MRYQKHPELPGSAPVPLRYKEEPTVNGEGKPLMLCSRCEGDGHVCTAEKRTIDDHGATIFQRIDEFPGTLRAKRERGGYTVTSQTCPDCSGAGLRVKGGSEL